jgi:uncharacterized protein YutE (UPF0331/DUF86 family)
MLAERVTDLKTLQRINFDEYLANHILRGYVERALQVSVQICLDISAHLIAESGWRQPEDNKDIFVVLAEEEIIPRDLLPALMQMAGFRNLIVHDYARVDDALVYGILKRHLTDFERFAASISRFLAGSQLEGERG